DDYLAPRRAASRPACTGHTCPRWHGPRRSCHRSARRHLVAMARHRDLAGARVIRRGYRREAQVVFSLAPVAPTRSVRPRPSPPTRGRLRSDLGRRPRRTEMAITNDRVIDDVRTELASDPRLPYSGEIAVESFGDTVTLRGTVGSFAQRRAAVADARRTRGVLAVYDELDVRAPDPSR